jgi:GntR family transcriptional regulator
MNETGIIENMSAHCPKTLPSPPLPAQPRDGRDNDEDLGYSDAVQIETIKKSAPAPSGLTKRDLQSGEPLFKPSERFHLNSSSPVPLYHQIERIILDRISTEGAVGNRFPREMDLVKIFGVSRITVKKVTDSLAAKGLIRRRRSLGTHISSLGVTEDLGRLTSYSEQMANRGMNVSTEVLRSGYHVPSAKIADKLKLKPGEQTLFIRRLRGTSEVFPVVLLQSEIPATFGVDVREDFSGSLYNLLEQKYNIKIEWAEEQISAARASAEEAKELLIPVGDVVLVMERQTFTSEERPLEFVRAVYRHEHYTFSIRLKR